MISCVCFFNLFLFFSWISILFRMAYFLHVLVLSFYFLSYSSILSFLFHSCVILFWLPFGPRHRLLSPVDVIDRLHCFTVWSMTRIDWWSSRRGSKWWIWCADDGFLLLSSSLLLFSLRDQECRILHRLSILLSSLPDLFFLWLVSLLYVVEILYSARSSSCWLL